MFIRQFFLLAIIFAGTEVLGSDKAICSDDRKLDELNGVWALRPFVDALPRLRSWQAAVDLIDANVASIRIQQRKVYFNLAWHEGDVGENCVRKDAGVLWARPGWESQKWFGPYEKVSRAATDDESVFYLGKFFFGCFVSELKEHWCLSPKSISVDGKKLPAAFQMDLSERPPYGTAFLVQGQRLPFLVFFPRGKGWAVFEDDWASSKNRVEVDPAHDKPWRTLSRQ